MLFHLRLFLWSWHWAPLRRLLLYLFYSYHQVFININKILLSLLFSRLSSPSFLSISLYERCSESLIIWEDFHQTWTSMFMSLLHWEARDWTRYFRCVSALMSRGEESPPWPGNALPDAGQEAVSLLCCEGALLAHGQLGVHRGSLVLSYTAACQAGASSLSSCLGLSISICWTLWGFCQPISLDFSASDCHYASLLGNFISSAILLTVHSAPSLRLWTKMLNHMASVLTSGSHSHLSLAIRSDFSPPWCPLV